MILATIAITLSVLMPTSGSALSGTAAAATPAPARVGAHICSPGATPIYACRFGAHIVSVCEQHGQLSYHYGRSALRRELTIPAGPDNRNVRYGTVIGQGGGHEEHVRFSNDGTEYIVFSGMTGRLSDRPGHTYSGLTVMRGANELSRRNCVRPSVGSNGGPWPSRIISTLPEEEIDGPFDGWF